MDTLDKVSEDSLRRVGWITTVAALTLANATPDGAFLIATETATRSIARIEETAREAIQELYKKKEDKQLRDKPAELAKELAKTANYYKNKLEHVAWREQHAIKSVKRLGENHELNAFLDKHCEDIASLGQKEIGKLDEALSFIAKASNVTLPAKLEETEAENELTKLIPRRLFRGTFGLSLKKELGEKEYEWYEKIIEKDSAFNLKLGEALNFMDGKRNAYDILKAVSAEYTETKPEEMLKVLKDLEKLKLITFQ
jgi:hypothetical protein